MKLKVACCFFVLFVFTGCQKNKTSLFPGNNDDLVFKDVKGMVFNACTDSGIAGIKVFLNISRDYKLYKSYETVSGLNGAYSFPGAELHSNPDFTYEIYIPSKSGEYPTDFESCGIDGTNMSFKLDEADIFMKPTVVPRFIYVNMYFIKGKLTNGSDSIIARFTQNIFHKNVPDFPYKFGDGLTGVSSGTYPKRTASYPMGPYSIVVDKWVSGEHSHWTDIIYLKYGDTASYILHW